jgi:hypothetical protein
MNCGYIDLVKFKKLEKLENLEKFADDIKIEILKNNEYMIF